jgi:hypothetical protein
MKRGLAVLLVVLSTGACSSSPTAPSGSEVEYRIVGSTTRASVSYRNATGGTTQSEITVPWSYRWSAERGDFLYLLALNKLDSGTIKAQIYKRGTLYKESESNRGFGSVAVSGTF